VKTGSTIRFKAADSPVVDLSSPIVRPTIGTIYSYEKAIQLAIGATGPVGAITNIRAYSSGTSSLGAGLGVKAGATATYVAPVNTVSILATTDFFTYTSSSPLSLGAGPYTGTNLAIGSFLYMQASVSSTAAAGLTTSQVLTIAYDES
jgi:hypothetical protein